MCVLGRSISSPRRLRMRESACRHVVGGYCHASPGCAYRTQSWSICGRLLASSVKWPARGESSSAEAVFTKRHPGGLADGEVVGPGPDVLRGRGVGELHGLGLPDEVVESCVAESAAVGGLRSALPVLAAAPDWRPPGPGPHRRNRARVIAGSVIRVELLPGPRVFELVVAAVLLPLGLWLTLTRPPGTIPEPALILLAAAVGCVGGIYGIGGGSILAPILIGTGRLVLARGRGSH
jgi:hypothetical protein